MIQKNLWNVMGWNIWSSDSEHHNLIIEEKPFYLPFNGNITIVVIIQISSGIERPIPDISVRFSLWDCYQTLNFREYSLWYARNELEDGIDIQNIRNSISIHRKWNRSDFRSVNLSSKPKDSNNLFPNKTWAVPTFSLARKGWE